jgi:hypothetical protein
MATTKVQAKTAVVNRLARHFGGMGSSAWTAKRKK